LNSRIISNESNNLKLTEKEINVIVFLSKNKKPQKVNVLQNEVWGYSSELETHTVETHIYRLRKKISDKFKDDNFIVSKNNGYIIK
jgi:DNA-binding response OmpR family regulator